MVKRGTAHIPNVTVLTTGPYLISSATFPSYFLKDRGRKERAACEIDIEIFVKYLSPRLSITRRYIGTEPISQVTAEYNSALKEKLSPQGIEVREIERVSEGGSPISASRVRELIKKRDTDGLLRLVPTTTLDYLKQKNYI
jgi:[citrate (pro-3S)-lyase] ligase